jgi:hypothetical protein
MKPNEDGRPQKDPRHTPAHWAYWLDCGVDCGIESTYKYMEIIQVVLDTKLLKAADHAARRRKLNRSALIREALHEHLERLQTRELEELDRRGYLAKPQRSEEFRVWEDAAGWPKD